jgi:hypothetical protein
MREEKEMVKNDFVFTNMTLCPINLLKMTSVKKLCQIWSGGSAKSATCLVLPKGVAEQTFRQWDYGKLILPMRLAGSG